MSRPLIELVDLRVSQLNGCALCLDMHSRALRKLGETDERLFTVAAWRLNCTIKQPSGPWTARYA